MKSLTRFLSAVVLVSLFGCGNDTLAPPEVHDVAWTWRAPYPGSDLLATAGSSQGFIAVGKSAIGTKSTDGTTWSISTYDGPFDLRDAAAVEDGWVAVGTNGLTAIYRTNRAGNPTIDPNFDFDGVVNSGARLVAVGVNRRSAAGGTSFSTDRGLTWSVVVGTAEPLHDVLWDGSRFVAAGDHGLVLQSANGQSWTGSRIDGAGTLVSIVSIWGIYLALNDQGVVFSSSDLNAWSQVATLPGARALGVGSRGFVAVGDAGKIWLARTRDSWRPVPTHVDTDLHDVAESNGVLVAVGDGGLVLRSEDGTTWTPSFSGRPSLFNEVRWTGSRFLMVDILSGFLSSPDGFTWQRQEVGYTGLIEDLVEYPGGYLAFNWNGGKSWLSSDGVTWERHVSNHPPYSLAAAVWFQGRFIGGGYKGSLLTSTDGFNWSELPSFTDQFLGDMIVVNGRILVGGETQVFVSEDAMTWTAVDGPQGLVRQWERSDVFGILGLSGRGLIQSQDGLSWTYHPSPLQATYGFFLDGSRVYVIGYEGKVASSTDLTTWTSEGSGTTNTLYSGAVSPTCALVVGENGMLLAKERWAVRIP